MKTKYQDGRMTKEQYLAWIASRGESSTWEHEDCRAADALIKHATLEALDAKLKRNCACGETRDFTLAMVRAHFGSVEVDDFLMALDCYPSWMVVNHA